MNKALPDKNLDIGTLSEPVSFYRIRLIYGSGGAVSEEKTLIAKRLGSVTHFVHNPVTRGENLVFPQSIQVTLHYEQALHIAHQLSIDNQIFRILASYKLSGANFSQFRAVSLLL